MPATDVETTCPTPVVEKEVEKIPEKSESNCEEKACEETDLKENMMKTTEESEKMEKENCPETENKDESKDEEKPASESEVMVEKTEDKPTQETEGKMTGNSKRKSTEIPTEADNQTQEEDSPPKKRKST